jgi:hypothetical protein
MHVRLWQRDINARNECTRTPLLVRQATELLGFSSNKKAAERLCRLHRAGTLKRTPVFQAAARGKPAFAYFTGTPPHPRTLEHTIAITDVRIPLARWTRRDKQYAAEFYYGHEVTTTAGIMPDAAVIIHKAEKTALAFVEVDNGTEAITSPTRYSLAKKLAAYANYYDAKTYVHDFAWAGTLRGFRVWLIVPEGRVRFVQHLIQKEQHDFVLITTFDCLNDGIDQPIWRSHDGKNVDLLGRAMTRDMVGELLRPPTPTATNENF